MIVIFLFSAILLHIEKAGVVFLVLSSVLNLHFNLESSMTFRYMLLSESCTTSILGNPMGSTLSIFVNRTSSALIRLIGKPFGAFHAFRLVNAFSITSSASLLRYL